MFFIFSLHTGLTKRHRRVATGAAHVVDENGQRLGITDIGTDTTGNENIVVMTVHGTETAVGLALEDIVFVAGQQVALDIAALAQHLYLVVDNERLGRTVHVKAPSRRCR